MPGDQIAINIAAPCRCCLDTGGGGLYPGQGLVYAIPHHGTMANRKIA